MLGTSSSACRLTQFLGCASFGAVSGGVGFHPCVRPRRLVGLIPRAWRGVVIVTWFRILIAHTRLLPDVAAGDALAYRRPQPECHLAPGARRRLTGEQPSRSRRL